VIQSYIDHKNNKKNCPYIFVKSITLVGGDHLLVFHEPDKIDNYIIKSQIERPIYSEPLPCYPPFTKQSIMKHMSINTIIITLTDPATNINQINILLLTYRLFMTSEQLLDKLIQRFHIHPSSQKDAQSLPLWMLTIRNPIQIRVCNTILKWIETYPMDWKDEIIQMISTFVRYTLTEFGYDDMKNMLNNALYNLKNQSASVILHDQPISIDQSWSLNCDETIFAQQLCIYMFEKYKKIKPTEFVGQVFTSKDKNIIASNYITYIDCFNKVSNWCQSTILASDTNRKKIIIKFINIAGLLWEMNNFCGFFVIIGALQTTPIIRLNVWNDIEFKFTKIFERYNTIVIGTKNYYELRKALKSIQDGKTAIPYLGLLTKDLISLYEGNPKIIDNFINFSRCVIEYNMISKMLSFSRNPYLFSRCPKILDMLENHILIANSELMK
jgi:son of sevenless-like protein